MICPGVYFSVPQLIQCDQPGACASCKIFSFGGAEVKKHLFNLETPGAQVIHDHQSCNVFICILRADGPSMFTYHYSGLEFKIKFFKMIRHAAYRTGTNDAVMVGKIKYRELIEFGDHIDLPVFTGCSHMLPESITVTAGRREGNRC